MTGAARALWIVAEPCHALTYFAPEAHDAFEAAGLRGFWRGYFAGRAAPLGECRASVATATFFGFRPDFVGRALPHVWESVTPEDAIEARLDGAQRAITGVAGDLPADAVRVATAVRRAAEEAPVGGRALFASNLELPWPATPARGLWHAATIVREHRGDGHVAALVAAGLDPCESHALRVAADAVPLDSIQPYRGWDDDDWSNAAVRLRARGLLSGDGRPTPEGLAVRAGVEAETDRASATLVDRIEDLDVVMRAYGSIATAVGRAAVVPYPNPIGVPAPETSG